MNNPFYEVIAILTSDKQNLRDLARMTRSPLFSFFRGADLRGLDLRGQDLTGMNFERADFRHSSLDEVSFDKGAFNGAKVDEAFNDLLDVYDVYLSDIESRYLSSVSIFYRFRENLLDELLGFQDVYFKHFAQQASTTTATLRRVRDGEAISNETVFGIAAALREQVLKLESSEKRGSRRLRELMSQPVLNVGYYDHRGRWFTIRRQDLPDLISILDFVNSVRYGNDWADGPRTSHWKPKPTTLDWMYHYYIRNPYSRWQITEQALMLLEKEGKIDNLLSSTVVHVGGEEAILR